MALTRGDQTQDASATRGVQKSDARIADDGGGDRPPVTLEDRLNALIDGKKR